MNLCQVAFWSICFGFVATLTLALWLLIDMSRAVELSIVGQASGQGLHLLNFTGEQLNVSILQNGSLWNLSIGGQA
jgi:hypothetical protein